MRLFQLLKILFTILIIIVMFLFFTRVFFNYYRLNITRVESSTDIIFKKNCWSKYMIGTIVFKDNSPYHYQQILKRISTWEKKQIWFLKYQITGLNYENVQTNYLDFSRQLIYSKPPLVNGYLLPYQLILFPKENTLLFLLNHYYCDGSILHDFIVYLILNSSEKSVSFLKYRHLPFVSEFLIVSFLLKTISRGFFNNSGTKISTHSKSIVVKKELDGTQLKKLDRWNVLAYIIILVFEYLSVDNLRVAFTVGIDDTHDFCNNRIGCINVNIPRLSHKEDYHDFLKKNLLSNKADSLISYEILRSYPTQSLRSLFNNKIDMVLTAFRIKYSSNLEFLSYDLNSICGLGTLPLYICSMTVHDKVHICLKSSTPQFDHNKFLLNEDNTKIGFYWGFSSEELKFNIKPNQ